jgi:hypothetical protein
MSQHSVLYSVDALMAGNKRGKFRRVGFYSRPTFCMLFEDSSAYCVAEIGCIVGDLSEPRDIDDGFSKMSNPRLDLGLGFRSRCKLTSENKVSSCGQIYKPDGITLDDCARCKGRYRIARPTDPVPGIYISKCRQPA